MENPTLAALTKWARYPVQLDQDHLMQKFLTTVQANVIKDYDASPTTLYSVVLVGLPILQAVDKLNSWQKREIVMRKLCDTLSLADSGIVLKVRVHCVGNISRIYA